LQSALRALARLYKLRAISSENTFGTPESSVTSAVPGIAIVTYKRPSHLAECLARVRAHTTGDYKLLVVSDEPANSEIESICDQFGASLIQGQNRGVVWNKNRALYYYMSRTKCDPILMLEDDCFPEEDNWLRSWIDATGRWHHVNYSHPGLVANRSELLRGTGMPDDPHVHRLVTGQCTSVSREAIKAAGYLDTRFQGYGHGHVAWSRRHYKLIFGDLVSEFSPQDAVFLSIAGGVHASNVPSFRNETEVAKNASVLRTSNAETARYIEPWRFEKERLELESEMDSILRPSPDNGKVGTQPAGYSSAREGFPFRSCIDDVSFSATSVDFEGWAISCDGLPLEAFSVESEDARPLESSLSRITRRDVVRHHPDASPASGFRVRVAGQEVGTTLLLFGHVGGTKELLKRATAAKVRPGPVRNVAQSPRLGIAAIMKNERPYIIQWLAHHRALGFTRFFIADNNSDDGSSELLSSLSDLGFIEHIPFPGEPNKAPQLPAYSEIIRRHRDDVDWLVFLDADEFLVPTDGAHSLVPFFEELAGRPDVGVVAINWAVYGSSGHLKAANDLLGHRFTKRADRDWRANHHFKSAVRMSASPRVRATPHLFGTDPEFSAIQTNGAPLENHPENGEGLSAQVVWDRLRINHFAVKSREEFDTRKAPKGRVDIIDRPREESYFLRHDRNETIDPMPDWLMHATSTEAARLENMLAEPNAPVLIDRSTPQLTSLSKSYRGFVDTIQFRTMTALEIRGWAIDENGKPATDFSVQVGGKSVRVSSVRNVARRDVNKAIPSADMNAGFEILLGIEAFHLARDTADVSVFPLTDGQSTGALATHREQQRQLLKQPEPSGRQKLVHRLYGEDPFKGLDPEDISFDDQGWNGRHSLLARVIKELRPKVIIDVGVWKGQSTLFFAGLLRDNNIDGFVVAVDTWLGSPEHWDRANRPDIFRSIALKHGYPSIYYTFASNAKIARLDNFIVPLAQTSRNAYHILRENLVADIVHIDAAHDYDSVKDDAKMYFELLAPGGVLIGDDYGWAEVKRAADDLSSEWSLPLDVDFPKWMIRKPTS